MKSRAIDKRSKSHPALEIIKARVEERVAAANVSKNEASRRAGLGLSYVNDLLSGKSLNPTLESLAKLATVLNTDVPYFFGEQDVPRVNMPATPVGTIAAEASASVPSHIPLFHIGLTDPDGFFALNANRRSTWASQIVADRDAYCITVPDDTMAPRYRIGEVVVVSPSTPIVSGGFAIIRQTDDRVAIREVVTITPDKITVRLLNDETPGDIPRSKVKSLERIVGCWELT